MKREDRLNLKKSWKPLIQKRGKEYTSALFSTVCIGPEKGLPDPSPIGPRWLPLPLPSLSHFPDSDQQIFNVSLGRIPLF